MRILPEDAGDAARRLYEKAWSDPTANADLCAEEFEERLRALLRAHLSGKTIKA
ncbi:hypothetical protein [Paraburkholderia elongata]|uniref:Uncharacterized protein n=1 Tax=Paraburkholderia elongata TaxID=2675747 RepID=A0A972SHD3_9BURK|nr:hypothetical protein [Paraburkholderia elongata]NPT54899.1 hypothetical protein [Paraburkholderia elongata]NPT60928.1 hypothetical protein [Paraburkholderia elongata]